MADDLIFYTNPMSRGRIVIWMLDEVDAPYQTEVVFYGDTIVTETAPIIAHLADAFPAAGLAPPSGQCG